MQKLISKCPYAACLEKALSELHHRAHAFLRLKISLAPHIIVLPAVKGYSNNSGDRPEKYSSEGVTLSVESSQPWRCGKI